MVYKMNGAEMCNIEAEKIAKENQLLLLKETIKYWDDHIISCKKLDTEIVTDIINRIYEENNLKYPQIVISDTPFEFFSSHYNLNRRYEIDLFGYNSKGASGAGSCGVAALNIVNSYYESNTELIKIIEDNSIFCAIRAAEGGLSENINVDDIMPSVLIFFDFINKLNGNTNHIHNDIKELILNGVFKIMCFEKQCLVMRGPTEINLNENGKLHSVSTQAVKFKASEKDTDNIYYIHGKHIHNMYFDNINDNNTNEHLFIRMFQDGILSECLEIIEKNNLNCNIPIEINVNELGLLHSKTDYAIKFKDGGGCYYINGKPDYLNHPVNKANIQNFIIANSNDKIDKEIKNITPKYKKVRWGKIIGCNSTDGELHTFHIDNGEISAKKIENYIKQHNPFIGYYISCPLGKNKSTKIIEEVYTKINSKYNIELLSKTDTYYEFKLV